MKKPPPPFTPRMLTEAEIDDLRQDMRRRHESNKKAIEMMDLSHLMASTQVDDVGADDNQTPTPKGHAPSRF